MKNEGKVMNQDNIWSYVQKEGIDFFNESTPRLRYLVNVIERESRVLNIGIGNGTFETLAKSKGIDIFSLDPDQSSIDSAALRLESVGKFQVGRVEKIPFESEYFDYVVMSEVIEHLDNDSLLNGLQEVSRVLKKNGKFIGTVPLNEDLNTNLTICPNCDCKFHRWGHVSSFSAESLKSLLEKSFSIISIDDVFFAENFSDGLKRAIVGRLKAVASYLNISTYGSARNLYFEVRRKN
jgi:ubiquinone/menaquinone biosynthesis C-methylase UbiE